MPKVEYNGKVISLTKNDYAKYLKQGDVFLDKYFASIRPKPPKKTGDFSNETPDVKKNYFGDKEMAEGKK